MSFARAWQSYQIIWHVDVGSRIVSIVDGDIIIAAPLIACLRLELIFEVANILEQLTVHGQFFPSDHLGLVQISTHIVLLIIHHRIL